MLFPTKISYLDCCIDKENTNLDCFTVFLTVKLCRWNGSSWYGKRCHCGSQITASSEWNVYHSSKQARLHTKETVNGRGAWVSLTNDLDQWLQVDLRKITPVTHVATQGRNSRSLAQIVTKYKLQFSDNGTSFLFYKRQGESADAVNVIELLLTDIFFHQLQEEW